MQSEQTTKHMTQIEYRTFVTEEILLNEYDYVYGAKKDEKVDFTWHNIKNHQDITKSKRFTYNDALDLARRRRNDGRYKNYEYLIG